MFITKGINRIANQLQAFVQLSKIIAQQSLNVTCEKVFGTDNSYQFRTHPRHLPPVGPGGHGLLQTCVGINLMLVPENLHKSLATLSLVRASRRIRPLGSGESRYAIPQTIRLSGQTRKRYSAAAETHVRSLSLSLSLFVCLSVQQILP